MARLNPSDFVGSRARFNRMRDAKIFNGWVLDFAGNQIELSTSTDAVVEIGDEFRVEAFGNNISMVFNAEIEDIGTISLETCDVVKESSSAQVKVVSAKQVTFRMRLVGQVKYSWSAESRRKRVDDLKCEVSYKGKELNCIVVDVSQQGLGVISTKKFESGEEFDVAISTKLGPVKGKATVRYCRPDADRPDHFRLGLLLEAMGRVDGPRWARFVEQAA